MIDRLIKKETDLNCAIFRPYGLTANSDVVCLCSGGVDSTVLLTLLSSFQKTMGFKLRALHFNYHLRGAESDRDQNFVEGLCQKMGVELIVQSCFLPDTKKSVQEKARNARLDYLKVINAKSPGSFFFLGHQANDQVETLLMRSERGAFFRGLSGMDIISTDHGLTLCRPLLFFPRDEIVRYASENQIAFVSDSSNAQTFYSRNKVRHGLLLDFLKEDSDFLEKALVFAAQMKKEHKNLEGQAQEFLQNELHSAKTNQGAAIFYLPYKKLMALSLSQLFTVCESIVQKISETDFFGFGSFCEWKNLIQNKTAFERAFGSCLLGKSDDFVYWLKKPSELTLPILLAGEGLHPVGNGLVNLKKIKSLPQSLQSRGSLFEERELYFSIQSNEASLYVRPLIPGDRFSPFGMKGKLKKVGDFLTDKKIPLYRRRGLRVLVSKNYAEEKIIAILGIEVDDRYQFQAGQDCYSIGFTSKVLIDEKLANPVI